MSAAIIEQLLLGILQAAPQLMQMYSTLKNGGTVSPAELNQVITKCGIDRAVFAAAISKSETLAKSDLPSASTTSNTGK